MLQCVDFKGADVRHSDGIYSRYLTEFDKDGTYKVRVEAIGEDGQVMLIEELKNRREGSQKFWPGSESTKFFIHTGRYNELLVKQYAAEGNIIDREQQIFFLYYLKYQFIFVF